MIRIIDKQIQKACYRLSYYIMVGDADGDIYEHNDIPLDYKHTETLFKILEKVYDEPGREFEDINSFGYVKKLFEKNVLTDEEFDFIVEEMLEIKEDYTFREIDNKWRDCQYLSFDNYESQGQVEYVGLLFIDEYGNEYNTEIV